MGGRARLRGDGRRSVSSDRRWLQDANHAGARRSGQRPTGGSPPPRRASARRGERRAGHAVFESYAYVSDLVEDKNTSIRRLRQLFFGSRTEKTEAVVGAKSRKNKTASVCDDAAADGSSADDTNISASGDSTAARGHGLQRRGLRRCRAGQGGAHPTLRAGDACPATARGPCTRRSRACWMRLVGGPPLSATVYQLQKLRMPTCAARSSLRRHPRRPVQRSTPPPPAA